MLLDFLCLYDTSVCEVKLLPILILKTCPRMGVSLCNLVSLVVFSGKAAPEVSMGCISLLGVC